MKITREKTQEDRKIIGLRASSSSSTFRQLLANTAIYSNDQPQPDQNIPHLSLSSKPAEIKDDCLMRVKSFQGNSRLLRTSRDHLYDENIHKIKTSYNRKTANDKQNMVPNMISSVPSEPTKIRNPSKRTEYQKNSTKQKNERVKNEYSNFTRNLPQHQMNNFRSVAQNIHKKGCQQNKNLVKIQSYEDKKFKTHQGYIPLMTKSRYETDSLSQKEKKTKYQDQDIDEIQDSRAYGQDNCQNYLNHHQTGNLLPDHRPITFGVIKRADVQDYDENQYEKNKDKMMPIKNSIKNKRLQTSLQHFEQQKRLTSQVLDEIEKNSIKLRKSQQVTTNNICRSSQEQLIHQQNTSQLQKGRNLQRSISGGSIRQNYHLNCNNKNANNRNNNILCRSVKNNGQGKQQSVCENHPAKKAKYKLLINNNEGMQNVGQLGKYGQNVGEKQQLTYCSKCAINLLQQGFKVQELGLKRQGNSTSTTKQLLKNHQHTHSANHISSPTQKQNLYANSNVSRIQEVRNLENRLNQISDTLQQNMMRKQEQLNKINSQMHQNHNIYTYLINCLQQMKKQQHQKISQIGEQMGISIEEDQKYYDQISQMKKQVKEKRNKYIVMREKQFKNIVCDFNDQYPIPQALGNSSQFLASKDTSSKFEEIMRILTIYAAEFNNKKGQLSNFQSSSQLHQQRLQNQQQIDSKIRQQQNFLHSANKKPFRTLFSQQEQKNTKNTFYRRNQQQNCISVDLYHCNQNQSPSFQKNQRPMEYSNHNMYSQKTNPGQMGKKYN